MIYFSEIFADKTSTSIDLVSASVLPCSDGIVRLDWLYYYSSNVHNFGHDGQLCNVGLMFECWFCFVMLMNSAECFDCFPE